MEHYVNQYYFCTLNRTHIAISPLWLAAQCGNKPIRPELTIVGIHIQDLQGRNYLTIGVESRRQ